MFFVSYLGLTLLGIIVRMVEVKVLIFCRTVVQVTVGKSQALYSSMSRPLRDKNSALLTVGAINIDIPQHPVALHGMMTRGTKQLSSTLQVRM